MQTKTCEERIGDRLKGRLTEIKAAMEDDNKREEFEDSILGITKRTVYKIELSWGGPADGFLITVDADSHEIESIEYYFQDWFDGAKRELTGDEFEAVAEVFSYLADV
jgi:hypothetical protein